MIHIPEPNAGDCVGCPAIYEVPVSYYSGMDLATCPKRKSCPCGFDPMFYRGCVRMRTGDHDR